MFYAQTLRLNVAKIMWEKQRLTEISFESENWSLDKSGEGIKINEFDERNFSMKIHCFWLFYNASALNLQGRNQSFLERTDFHVVLKSFTLCFKNRGCAQTFWWTKWLINVIFVRVLCCSNAVESQKAFLKRSIYLLFKVFFTPQFLSRTLESGAEPLFLYLSEQLNVCVHACGREDWRAWHWPPCVGCSKDIYDNIALFLQGTRRDTLPYKHQRAQTGAIASPWCVASKEPPPSLTAEAILLQQRDHYF